MDDLTFVAEEIFGLTVDMLFPISESFSSSVLLFVATDGDRYAIKRPHAPNKAEREMTALRALDQHSGVPTLLGRAEHNGATYLLIEGLDAEPWDETTTTSPELLRSLGRSMRRIHDVEATDFHGLATWHELLRSNADRYLAAIGPDDGALAWAARQQLERSLPDIPDATTASLVHFDLRPGNILVRDGALAGVIDFEACRGGHASMDFFKLWEHLAPDRLGLIVDGYVEDNDRNEWIQTDRLEAKRTPQQRCASTAGPGPC